MEEERGSESEGREGQMPFTSNRDVKEGNAKGEQEWLP